jgi:hypothetical protein
MAAPVWTPRSRPSGAIYRRSRFGGWKHCLRFDAPLELLVTCSIALVVRALFHWLGGSVVKVMGDLGEDLL